MGKRVIINIENYNEDIINKAVKLGFTEFMIKTPEEAGKLLKKYENLTVYHPTNGGFVKNNKEGRSIVGKIHINSPKELEKIVELGRQGEKEIYVGADNWRIIPLENLIAMKQDVGISVIAEVDKVEDVELFFGILEKGVDGTLVNIRTRDDLLLLNDITKAPSSVSLVETVVEEITDVGMGDRVCVDTISMLEYGEGLLIGSTSNMFFLIHNESIGSAFTSPRPFRVNAGAVHSYILMPDGKTKYLSEISSGDRVLIVRSDGRTRVTAVGRAKIERRPMSMVKVSYGGEYGIAAVQKAETIRFITQDNKLIPITELKEGDKILCHIPGGKKGRHFGMAVDETIVEK